MGDGGLARRGHLDGPHRSRVRRRRRVPARIARGARPVGRPHDHDRHAGAHAARSVPALPGCTRGRNRRAPVDRLFPEPIHEDARPQGRPPGDRLHRRHPAPSGLKGRRRAMAPRQCPHDPRGPLEGGVSRAHRGGGSPSRRSQTKNAPPRGPVTMASHPALRSGATRSGISRLAITPQTVGVSTGSAPTLTATETEAISSATARIGAGGKARRRRTATGVAVATSSALSRTRRRPPAWRSPRRCAAPGSPRRSRSRRSGRPSPRRCPRRRGSTS